MNVTSRIAPTDTILERGRISCIPLKTVPTCKTTSTTIERILSI